MPSKSEASVMNATVNTQLGAQLAKLCQWVRAPLLPSTFLRHQRPNAEATPQHDFDPFPDSRTHSQQPEHQCITSTESRHRDRTTPCSFSSLQTRESDAAVSEPPPRNGLTMLVESVEREGPANAAPMPSWDIDEDVGLADSCKSKASRARDLTEIFSRHVL